MPYGPLVVRVAEQVVEGVVDGDPLITVVLRGGPGLGDAADLIPVKPEESLELPVLEKWSVDSRP